MYTNYKNTAPLLLRVGFLLLTAWAVVLVAAAGVLAEAGVRLVDLGLVNLDELVVLEIYFLVSLVDDDLRHEELLALLLEFDVLRDVVDDGHQYLCVEVVIERSAETTS